MKKIISKQKPAQQYLASTKCSSSPYQNQPPLNDLHIINKRILQNTINSIQMNSVYNDIINKILERQPSLQSIQYQQCQKNLSEIQHLVGFYDIEKVTSKIGKLIKRGISQTKMKYMDFKLQNFIILNKYSMVRDQNRRKKKIKFKCLEIGNGQNNLNGDGDEYDSSTKSVENKILQQLQKQDRKSKRQFKERPRKRNDKSHIQIRQLTSKISQMIRDIKDNRALDKFKRQMQSKRTFPIMRFVDLHQKSKERQFKRNLQSDMTKLKNININSNNNRNSNQQKSQICSHRQQAKSKSKSTKKLMNMYGLGQHHNNIGNSHQTFLKNGLKPQNNDYQDSTSQQRLKTNPFTQNSERLQTQYEEYGLSVIKRRKKSKGQIHHEKSSNKNTKDKTIASKQKSNYSKHSTSKNKNSLSQKFMKKQKSRAQQKPYQSSKRLNTGQSNATIQKSKSRIPTQYETTQIHSSRNLKKKSKSKSKHDLLSFGSKTKRFEDQYGMKTNNKKSKSKEKSRSHHGNNNLISSRSKSKTKITINNFKFHMK